jgi:hypothetical protein
MKVDGHCVIDCSSPAGPNDRSRQKGGGKGKAGEGTDQGRPVKWLPCSDE